MIQRCNSKVAMSQRICYPVSSAVFKISLTVNGSKIMNTSTHRHLEKDEIWD